MKTIVLNKKQIEQKINRIAHEIYENNFEEDEIIVAGIANRGHVLAKRIAKVLESISPMKVQLGKIEINKKDPLCEVIKFPLTDVELRHKVVFLVDDVINSGKTLIYAVKHFLKVPVKKLRTVVLVDRSHNIFPVKADYVGISLSTTLQEHVTVELGKGKEVVYLQ